MQNYFKVNRMFLSGRRKKIFKQMDVVTESDVENLVELVSNGSLIPCDKDGGELFDTDVKQMDVVTESDVENLVEVEKEEVAEEEKQAPIYTFKNSKGIEVEVYSVKEATVNSMRAELILKGIEFDASASKDELFQILLNSIEK
jgi:hypothetical protein